jgi:cation diffusion facilitator CzcD-associated flavoprotein CzcO
MAVDTPAKIAILGAGPIGLEAALYARFLGYDVLIYEQAREVAGAVEAWGHVRMFTPFGMNRSPLGLAALTAQDAAYRPPPDEELLTGQQWRQRYLVPLAQTDLLADHLRLSHRVLAVGKEALLKGELVGDEERGDWSFRILARDGQGRERIDEADVVIDCTGVFCGPPAWLGHGGIPALGERELAAAGAIDRGLPDLAGKDRQRFAGKHTLLIGSGYSAATNVVALAELAWHAPGTKVTWITRKPPSDSGAGPIALVENDRLPERQALARRANALAAATEVSIPNAAMHTVTHWPGTVVEAMSRLSTDGPWEVRLAGQHAGTFTFDRILANVGFRPDRTLYEELHVHECYASEGPMKLAAALTAQSSGDCLNQTTCGPQTLVTPEPNFYILGAKSYGRKSNFLLSVGLDQIRELFTIIGDRPSLDLYASVKPLR